MNNENLVKKLTNEMSIKYNGPVTISGSTFFQYEVIYEKDGSSVSYNLNSEVDIFQTSLDDEELSTYITNKLMQNPLEKTAYIGASDLNITTNANQNTSTVLSPLQQMNISSYNYKLSDNYEEELINAEKALSGFGGDAKRAYESMEQRKNFAMVHIGSLPAKYSDIANDATTLMTKILSTPNYLEDGIAFVNSVSAIITRDTLGISRQELNKLKRDIESGKISQDEVARIIYGIKYGENGENLWEEFNENKLNLFKEKAGDEGEEAWKYHAQQYINTMLSLYDSAADGKVTFANFNDIMGNLDNFYRFNIGVSQDDVKIELDNGTYDECAEYMINVGEMTKYADDNGFITLRDATDYLKDSTFCADVSTWSVFTAVELFKQKDMEEQTLPKFEDYVNMYSHALDFERVFFTNNSETFIACKSNDFAKESGKIYECAANGTPLNECADANTWAIQYATQRGWGKDSLPEYLWLNYENVEKANTLSNFEAMTYGVITDEELIVQYDKLKESNQLPLHIKYNEHTGKYYSNPTVYNIIRDVREIGKLEEMRKNGTLPRGISYDSEHNFYYCNDSQMFLDKYYSSVNYLPYNMAIVDGIICQRQYNAEGMKILEYSDIASGEYSNANGKPVYTSFTSIGQTAANSRNWQLFATNDLELSYETQKKLSESVDDITLLFDIDYFNENKDRLLVETGIKEEILNDLSNAYTTYTNMYGEVFGKAIARSTSALHTKIMTMMQLGLGLCKFGENIVDALVTVANSDYVLEMKESIQEHPILSILLGSAIVSIPDIIDNYNSYTYISDTMWSNFTSNEELYNQKYNEFWNSNYKKSAENEWLKLCFPHTEVPNNGGTLYQYVGDDGKWHFAWSINDIPSDIREQFINNNRESYESYINDKFKSYIESDWKISDSSSSSQVDATILYGVRTGDFSLYDGLSADIHKNAAYQFSAMDFVKTDYVGDWAEKNLYSQKWYEYLEANSFVKHDNILGQVANQIGNMAVPVLVSLIPVVGQAASSALLFTSAFGGASEEAFQSGAGYNEALGYATLSAATELLIEKVFSGIQGFGEGWLDNILNYLPDKFINKIGKSGSKAAQTLKKLITGGIGEGIEEVTTDLVTPLWKSLTYMSDKSWLDIVKEEVSFESLAQTFLVSFLSSMVFGSGEIIQKTNYVNKISNELRNYINTSGVDINTNEVINMFNKQMKEILAQYIGGALEGIDITKNGILEKIINDASIEIAQNPEFNETLTKLQQVIKQYKSEHVTIKVNSEAITMTREDLNNLVSQLGLKEKFSVEDGVLVFDSPKVQDKFYKSVDKFVNKYYQSINSDIRKLANDFVKAQKKGNIDMLSQAIGIISTNSETGILQLLIGENVQITVDGKEYSIPKFIVENLSTNIEILENNTIEFKNDTTFRDFLNLIYGKAIEICNEKLTNNFNQLKEKSELWSIDEGKADLTKTAIDIIKSIYADAKSNIIITNSEKVDEENLLKIEVQFTIDEKQQKVNVYIDQTTDSNVYEHSDKFLNKIQEIINKNKGSSDIYVGEMKYDKASDNITITQNKEHQSYIESINAIRPVINLGNSQIEVTNAEIVEDHNMIKAEVEVTVDGEKQTVNVYIDQETDSKVYKHQDKVLEKIQEVISENEGSSDVYIGKMEYDAANDSVTTTQNGEHQSYVDSQNHVLIAAAASASTSATVGGVVSTETSKSSSNTRVNNEANESSSKKTSNGEVKATETGTQTTIVSVTEIRSQVESYIENINKELNKFIETHKNDANFEQEFEKFKQEKLYEFNEKLNNAKETIKNNYSDELRNIDKAIAEANEDSRSNLESQREKIVSKMNNEITSVEDSMRSKFTSVINTATETVSTVKTDVSTENNVDEKVENRDNVEVIEETKDVRTDTAQSQNNAISDKNKLNDLLPEFNGIPSTIVYEWISGERQIDLGVRSSMVELAKEFARYVRENNIVLSEDVMNKLNVIQNLSENQTILNLQEFFNGQNPIVFDKYINVNGTSINIESMGKITIVNLNEVLINPNIKPVILPTTINGIDSKLIYECLTDINKLNSVLNGEIDGVDANSMIFALKTVTQMQEIVGIRPTKENFKIYKAIQNLYGGRIEQIALDNIKSKLSQVYHDFNKLYGDTRDITKSFVELEKMGYTHFDIVEALISQGATITDYNKSRELYNMAYDYLIDKGYRDVYAANKLSEICTKINNLRGYETIYTQDGLRIHIQKGLNWDNQAYHISYVQQEITRLKGIYKTNIPVDVYVYDTFNPEDKKWELEYKKPCFRSAATGGTGVINIYANEEINDAVISHEYGHLIDEQIRKDFGLNERFANTNEWQTAIARDGNAPTNYAKTNAVEDFAESVAKIVEDPIAFKNKFPARFEVLSK